MGWLYALPWFVVGLWFSLVATLPYKKDDIVRPTNNMRVALCCLGLFLIAIAYHQYYRGITK